MTAEPSVDVAVIGGGIAGLVAALDCARAGRSVLVLEARDSLGGCVGSAEVAGLRLDTGAESFATRGGAVERLLGELGLGDAVVDTGGRGAWLRRPARGGAVSVPLPPTALLGIPARPLDPAVRSVVGWAGGLRASADLMLPGAAPRPGESLARLVRRRLGARVLERLVAPVSVGVYSTDPGRLNAALLAPGLARAARREHSLIRGAASLRAEAPAGAAVRGVRGGMNRLVAALASELGARGAEVRAGDGVAAVRPAGGAWRVTTSAGREVAARTVIVAAAHRSALGLLYGAGVPTGPVPAAETVVDIVTLVIDDARLDAAPRGSGVLVSSPRSGSAKALTHSTAKWPWLAAEAGPGRHVLRLSYSGGSPRQDDETWARALADASAILGTPLRPERVLGHHRTRWEQAPSHALIGRASRDRELDGPPGLVVTGAWVAGTGLASVIPHARAAAARAIERLDGAAASAALGTPATTRPRTKDLK